MTKAVATILIAIAGVISIAAGVTAFLSTEFTPYNAVIAGMSWADVAQGLQSVMLGMQKIMGGGFLTTGCALLLLILPMRRGEMWSHYAALLITSTFWVPTLYVAMSSRSIAPAADTPVIPSIVVIGLASIGIGLSLMVNRRTAEA